MHNIVRTTGRRQGRAPAVRLRRQATGEYEDFMTGFVISDKQVWSRPVGVAVAKDGSLFVTEDGNGTIWRVNHQKVASSK